MGKKIPVKIAPDTIVTALFEIRFQALIKEEELLGILYPILIKNFPTLTRKKHAIPEEIRGHPDFRYLADYTFSNESFSVSFGSNVLVFEYLKDYKGWDDFYSNIKGVSEGIGKGIFGAPERLSVRYINILTDVSLEQALDINVRVGLDLGKQKLVTFRNQFLTEGTTVLLTVIEQGKLRKGSVQMQGVIIDLDVSCKENLPPVGTELLPIISKLHEEEKFVFFNVLRQDFIDSRSPTY